MPVRITGTSDLIVAALSDHGSVAQRSPVMKQKQSSRRRRSSTKSVLRLPDLEHPKTAVYLQTGQDQLARNVRDEVSSYSDRFGETPRAAYSALVGIPARYALERHQWSEAAALQIRKVPMPLYEAETYFARAIGCARTGDLAGAVQC